MNENTKKVFEMLGIEPNEKFKIGSDYFRVTETLDVLVCIGGCDYIDTSNTLAELITQKLRVTKINTFIGLMNWKPEVDEKYWFVNQYGEICRDKYCDDKTTEDYQYLYANSKIYPTEAMAERKKEIQEKYLELGHTFTIEEWQNQRIVKHSLFIDHNNKIVSGSCYNFSQGVKYTFKTKTLAKQFIDFLGETQQEQYEQACLYL